VHIKNIFLIIICLCILALSLFIFLNFYKNNNHISPFITEKPIHKDITQYINANGTLKAKEQVSVGSLVSGRVIKILAEDNDMVKKDQLLAVIDDGIGDSNIKKLKALLKESKATWEYQQKFYARELELYKEGQLAKNTFEKYQQDYTISKEKVKEVSADLETAQKTYNNLFIKSPANGIVIAKKIDLGQMVASMLMATVLFEIAKDLHQMEAYVDVDEADIGMVKPEQESIFTVDAFPKKHFNASVKRVQYQAKIIDNVVTYAAVLDVSNPDYLLRPGMTITADIKVAQEKQTLTVPSKALRMSSTVIENTGKASGFNIKKIYESEDAKKIKQEKAGGKASKKTKDTLWVVDNNTVQQVEVELGITDGKNTQILKGITEGSNVITDMKEITRENPIFKIFKQPGGIGR